MALTTHQVKQGSAEYIVEAGNPYPLGATPDTNGVNFSIFSEHTTSVELLLFDRPNNLEPNQVIKLDYKNNRTFQFWHVYVRGLKPWAGYAYRVDNSQNLHRTNSNFNRNKVLIDPYAKGNTNVLWNRIDALGTKDNLATSMRSVVVDLSDYDWEGDCTLNRPMRETIIYEMHVGGFTKSPSSNCKYPGTFHGIKEKIPYLQSLGITAVELLPVFDFDEKEIISEASDRQLTNYWGYDPHSFFALEGSYCASSDVKNQLKEFRDLVKALHKAGIEVILDVVFNHTSEGNHFGPVINFKGLDNNIYYHLVENNSKYYMNYSGCGNTLNCNHPIVIKLILEALEFWVKEMHIDGFRFDEASILARSEDGTPMTYPPLTWAIETSEILANTKIIAEAWDADGLYQIGDFPGYRWAEWNGHFRDNIRCFVKGDLGLVGTVAERICGSPDLYQQNRQLPINSINFITCHDGFTLNDLVSYNSKHNEANGQTNKDGINNNLSWNCGVEGKTDNLKIESLRHRQIKNFITILLLSRGVPMILAGDEVRRTQRGNNNAYCQDNNISWFDWNLVEKNADTLRFFKLLINFRKQHAVLNREYFGQSKINKRGLSDLTWHGCKLHSPGWNNPNAAALAFTLGGFEEEADIHVMLNMHWEKLDFEIPLLEERKWYRVIDTHKSSPKDILQPDQEIEILSNTYQVEQRSIVVATSK